MCRTAGDRDVGHEVVAGRAMPVLLCVGGHMDVAWVELDDVLAARLDQTAAFGDVEVLATFVGVPRGPGARVKVHGADVQLRVALGLDDRVDPHGAGEPLGRPLHRGRPRLDGHLISCGFGAQRSSTGSLTLVPVGVVAQLARRSSASWERLPGSAL